nr:MAG TPA: hypothetical protein [Caudoviricetes sp.]
MLFLELKFHILLHYLKLVRLISYILRLGQLNQIAFASLPIDEFAPQFVYFV